MTKNAKRLMATMLVTAAAVFGGLGATYLWLLKEQGRIAQPPTAAEFAAMDEAREARRR